MNVNDDIEISGRMNESDDIEIDNRIKELLLSSHNLFLVTQVHEKEIREMGPIVKELPQMLGGLSRLIGEKGEDAGAGPAVGFRNPRPEAGIGRGLFIGVTAGSSILTAAITSFLIKFLFS